MTYLSLIKAEPRPLLFAMCNAFFSCFGQSHFLALFSLTILQQYHLTNTHFGTIYAGATLLSAVFLPIIGPWIDRVDVRKYCLLILVSLTLGYQFLLSTSSVVILFASLFLLRFAGQGLCTHVNGVCTARYFGNNRGKALSLTNIGFPVAEGLFTPMVAALVLIYSPQIAIYFLLSLLLAVYFPVTFFITRKNSHFNKPLLSEEVPDHHTSQKNWHPHQVLRHGVFYLLISHSLFPAFSLSGFLIYQMSYAQTKSWPLNTVALAMSLFAVGRLLSAFLTGPLVDRLGALRLFPFYQLPLALAFSLLWYFETSWIASIGLFLCGITVGAAAPIKSSMWAELYGVAHLGAIKSLFATIVVIVTSLSPLFFGWMIDRDQHIFLLLLLTLMSLITTALGTFAVYLYKKETATEQNLSHKR
jgi:MFS family permease